MHAIYAEAMSTSECQSAHLLYAGAAAPAAAAGPRDVSPRSAGASPAAAVATAADAALAERHWCAHLGKAFSPRLVACSRGATSVSANGDERDTLWRYDRSCACGPASDAHNVCRQFACIIRMEGRSAHQARVCSCYSAAGRHLEQPLLHPPRSGMGSSRSAPASA